MDGTVLVYLELVDPELDAEALQGLTRSLLKQVEMVDGVEEASLLPVELMPEGTMALGGFLVGLLMAEVSPGNLQKLGGFLKDRVVGKTMKMSVEACGKKVSVEASSQVEFDYQLQKAEEMIQRWAEDSKKT